VTVRFVTAPSELGTPDLVVLPGSKATVADLAWLRTTGLGDAVVSIDALVLGICGGYQMLGRRIVDEVEARDGGAVEGLAMLDVETVFVPAKVTRQRTGVAMGEAITGYEIHHGVVARGAGAAGWVHLDTGGAARVDDEVEDEGAVDLDDAHVLGTSVHGLFENDGFRAQFLMEVGRRAGKAFVPAGVSFAAAREAQFDRFADVLEAHLDLDALWSLVESAAIP
jgi:adenosylcobyric acid synthase